MEGWDKSMKNILKPDFKYNPISSMVNFTLKSLFSEGFFFCGIENSPIFKKQNCFFGSISFMFEGG